MSVLSESPVPENGTPGSMRGMWKRNYGPALREGLHNMTMIDVG